MPSLLTVLQEDHANVSELLEQLSETTTRASKKRRDLVEKVATEIEVHSQLEEEIFYPALRDASRKKAQKEMVAEALEEHRAVGEMVLPDLRNTEVDSIEFSGRAKVLRELVEHHVEEEEDEVFALAEELLDEDELEELSERWEARKEELLAEHRAA